MCRRAGQDQSPVIRLKINSPVHYPSEQFISYAKANPGKLNYASAGAGSTSHLTGELFKAMSNTKIVQVPYQGIAPAMLGLMGGQVDVLFDSTTNALPYIKAGNVKVLAVGSEKRAASMPDTDHQ